MTGCAGYLLVESERRIRALWPRRHDPRIRLWLRAEISVCRDLRRLVHP